MTRITARLLFPVISTFACTTLLLSASCSHAPAPSTKAPPPFGMCMDVPAASTPNIANASLVTNGANASRASDAAAIDASCN